MGRFWLFFFIADIIVTAAALISCLSTEEEDIRALPRIVWVIIILLFSPIGAIVWFAAGKARVSPKAGTWRAGGGFPEAARPGRTVAPDDNPDFLRNLDRQRAELEAAEQTEQEREMLRKWEEDLKRREDEIRKRDNPDG
ncbi:PLD nuclease N-terminal domain-containing protein [Catelliglobosispora koreensis]|uniref:PLD nuclease N-terminal domain-containing protein n=1 Tax=Catelliglobosispora koreensis TaxID=129052 RepID=UPI000378DD12|nr:PLD nuclease N-terminal domain-containing protein [Catelliglobosispora koreensis]